MMNQRKNLIEGVDRCGRVYDHSGLASVCCDQVKGAIEMDAGFLVDGDPVGAGFGDGRDEVVGTFDHEMAVERDLGNLAEGGDYGRADRKIGDEVAVHDVDVENGSAAFDGGLRFRA
jgi:hypothetical protein